MGKRERGLLMPESPDGKPGTRSSLNGSFLSFLRVRVCVALPPCPGVIEHSNGQHPTENKGKSHTSNKLSSFREESGGSISPCN